MMVGRGTCVGLHWRVAGDRTRGTRDLLDCVCDACVRDVMCNCGCDLLEWHRTVRLGMSECSCAVLCCAVKACDVAVTVGEMIVYKQAA
jgi:hypothetical protein